VEFATENSIYCWCVYTESLWWQRCTVSLSAGLTWKCQSDELAVLWPVDGVGISQRRVISETTQYIPSSIIVGKTPHRTFLEPTLCCRIIYYDQSCMRSFRRTFRRLSRRIPHALSASQSRTPYTACVVVYSIPRAACVVSRKLGRIGGRFDKSNCRCRPT